jgi:phosphoglycolate phosphatase-like HAD superfamily hydrolase
VEETLSWLQERERHLYITTNKRHVATMALLRKFSLQARFDAIITPDQRIGARLTKVDMLWILRREHGLSSGETVFIGDTMGDCLAARDCEFDFIMVTYGYGTLDRNDLVSRRVRTIDTIYALSDDDL